MRYPNIRAHLYVFGIPPTTNYSGVVYFNLTILICPNTVDHKESLKSYWEKMCLRETQLFNNAVTFD